MLACMFDNNDPVVKKSGSLIAGEFTTLGSYVKAFLECIAYSVILWVLNDKQDCERVLVRLPIY